MALYTTMDVVRMYGLVELVFFLFLTAGYSKATHFTNNEMATIDKYEGYSELGISEEDSK
jgi:hypothetical protein